MSQTLYSLFAQQVRQHPDKPAVILGDQRMTYAELDQASGRLCAQLAGLGVRTGEHVGVLLPNGLEYLVLMMAAARMGLVLVPHNMSLSPAMVYRAFARTDVRHLVVWHSRCEEVRRYWDSQAHPSGVWVAVGGAAEGCQSFADLLAKEAEAAQFAVDADNPYILTMTSGSTGDPKPIVLSQQTKIARAQGAIALYGLSANDITLAATPLYHSLAERLVLIPLISGGTSVVMSGFTAQAWLDAVNQHAVSFSILVSSQVKQILDLCKGGAVFPASLRSLVASSERLSDALKKDLMAVLKCEFHECYGASEIAIATDLCTDTQRSKWASVGKPLPGVDVQILSKAGELAAVGEEGEILCKTPMQFSGYYQRPDVTQAAYWNGYFRTGDLGRLDADGFLYFLGRDKETIKTGGINVYPRDVEEVILKHPQVSECAVVAAEDERFGEVVAAVVVGNLDEAQDLRAIRLLCARELADYQQPRRIYRVEKLPRNPMGKVMKQQLSDDIKGYTPVVSL